MELERILRRALDRRQQQQQRRQRTVMEPLDGAHVRSGDRTYINFASNNYLGLTHHRQILAAMRAAEACSAGAGAGAAALICGYGPAHASAEAALARWKSTESALLLPSGYQANHAAVQTLAAVTKEEGGVRFLIDKLAHASLIDAVRGSGQPFRIFPHNHLGKLRRLLEGGESQLQVVVTESIFSMDGDAADLPGLVELKRRHGFVLLLDEAHGSGVYGAGGAGYAAECGLEREVDLAVVTFSKALGCMGGAICGSQTLIEAAINYAPAAIYSTSISPVLAAGVEAAIDVVQREPQRQHRLRQLARQVRQRVRELGFTLPPGDSPIIPIIMGSEEAALSAAQSLRDRGLLVPAVRPPTVPRGTSRLRVTLSSEHTDEEVEQLIEALKEVREFTSSFRS